MNLGKRLREDEFSEPRITVIQEKSGPSTAKKETLSFVECQLCNELINPVYLFFHFGSCYTTICRRLGIKPNLLMDENTYNSSFLEQIQKFVENLEVSNEELKRYESILSKHIKNCFICGVGDNEGQIAKFGDTIFYVCEQHTGGTKLKPQEHIQENMKFFGGKSVALYIKLNKFARLKQFTIGDKYSKSLFNLIYLGFVVFLHAINLHLTK